MISAMSGVRVLEIAHYIAGPQCCQILADHGAEVIKVEPPDGEMGRRAQPVHDGDSLYFAANNRTKRAITLDLRSEQGKEVLHELIGRADVLVTNYANGVPDRLGFGFDEVHRINPRAVMVHITGFGRTGPYSSWVAYDGIIQAMSGLADMTGEPDGAPTIAGPFVADNVTGMQAAMAAMLGLLARERTGRGQLIDVGMLDSMFPLLAHHLSVAAAGIGEPTRWGSALPTNYSGLYPAGDGWVYIAPITPKMWESFSALLGHPEWAEQEAAERGWRVRERERIDAQVVEWTRGRTKAEVVAALQADGVVCGPVQSVADLVSDPQVRARGIAVEVPLRDGVHATVPGPALRLADTPARSPGRPPGLGEHTDEVLAQLGYSAERISALHRDNVTGRAS
ncbi:CoA:oxalate CoA-transferase [Saccharopolyspora shandongensis]|uniref:CoA:oxalate CoA-transferase n=1 Tax=Saccharopolyspora shandongensis TaxID=418495 RepID=A0A1H3KTV9_9PSEU|nr:CoA transferase [Saccharopolyspora shandongensis]SDY55530.1 CoA:oxalate CoA-transferase [Saccharopolyspora shandongensis]